MGMNNKILSKYKSFINNLSNKKFFLVQVFSNLIFQILIAYLVLEYAEKRHFIQTSSQYIFLSISLFALILLIIFIPSPIIKFILFCIFSGCIGLLLSYKFDERNPEEAEIAKKAFITTISIFVMTVLFGFFLVFIGVHIPYQVSILLFITLLCIIIVIFITSITGNYSKYHKIIAGIIIFVFTIFIAYDTVNIMDREYYGDFISASMDYFLDILNLFVASESIMS
jgi:FtsH-binding integral membrane protein